MSKDQEASEPEWLRKSKLDFAAQLANPIPRLVNEIVVLPSGRTLHNPAQRTIKSADRMANQLISSATASGGAWKEGMANPSRPPAEAALAAAPKWAEAVKLAVANKSFEKGVAKISQSEINATINALGEGVYTQGISAREAKIKRVMATIQPQLQAASNAAQAMADATPADREKRMIANLHNMRQVSKNR